MKARNPNLHTPNSDAQNPSLRQPTPSPKAQQRDPQTLNLNPEPKTLNPEPFPDSNEDVLDYQRRLAEGKSCWKAPASDLWFRELLILVFKLGA